MKSKIHIFTEVFEKGVWKTYKDRCYPHYDYINKRFEQIKKDEELYLKFLFCDEHKKDRHDLEYYRKERADWIKPYNDYSMFAILSDAFNHFWIKPFKRGSNSALGWPNDYDQTAKCLNEKLYHSFTTYYPYEIDGLKKHIYNLYHQNSIDEDQYEQYIEYVDLLLFKRPLEKMKKNGINEENIRFLICYSY